jgi:hypothetical protein
MFPKDYCLIFFNPQVDTDTIIKQFLPRYVNKVFNKSVSVTVFTCEFDTNDIKEALCIYKQKYILIEIGWNNFMGDMQNEEFNAKLFGNTIERALIFRTKGSFMDKLSDEQRLKKYLENEEYLKAGELHKKILEKKKKKDEI